MTFHLELFGSHMPHVETLATYNNKSNKMNVVCEQTISFAEHTGNFAQQSDLFAAVKAACEQMILSTKHTANSVLYPDFCCSAAFLLDNYVPQFFSAV